MRACLRKHTNTRNVPIRLIFLLLSFCSSTNNTSLGNGNGKFNSRRFSSAHNYPSAPILIKCISAHHNIGATFSAKIPKVKFYRYISYGWFVALLHIYRPITFNRFLLSRSLPIVLSLCLLFILAFYYQMIQCEFTRNLWFIGFSSTVSSHIMTMIKKNIRYMFTVHILFS